MTSSLAAVTALVYMVPLIVRVPFLFVWDFILFILWIALFGLFGSMFIKENPEGNGGIKRMKNAVVCIPTRSLGGGFMLTVFDSGLTS